MALWNDTYSEIMEKPQSTDKVSVLALEKGTRIMTAGGSVAVITGRQHKSSSTIQIKFLSGELENQYDWLSNIAMVYLAK